MRPSYEYEKKRYETRIKNYGNMIPRMEAECKTNTVCKFITCFKEKVEDGWKFSGECHDFWELVYVSEGFIYVAIENKPIKLKKGDLFFFMPMEFHQMWCEDCDQAKFTVISFGVNDDITDKLGGNIIELDTEKREEFSQIYHLIYEAFDVNLYVAPKEAHNRNLIEERICFNKFEHFLLSLLNNKIYDEQKRMSKGNINYKLIIDTMNENINKNLTIEELATLCNLSVSNLKKTFKKYGNEGVMKYFNQLKINRAIKFLRRGYTAAQIAQEMGYSSQNYFSIVFKRETGMLPSEFKKKNS